jgi:hypothetical protein
MCKHTHVCARAYKHEYLLTRSRSVAVFAKEDIRKHTVIGAFCGQLTLSLRVPDTHTDTDTVRGAAAASADGYKGDTSKEACASTQSIFTPDADYQFCNFMQFEGSKYWASLDCRWSV